MLLWNSNTLQSMGGGVAKFIRPRIFICAVILTSTNKWDFEPGLLSRVINHVYLVVRWQSMLLFLSLVKVVILLMRLISPICCGLDIHKNVIVATIVTTNSSGISSVWRKVCRKDLWYLGVSPISSSQSPSCQSHYKKYFLFKATLKLLFVQSRFVIVIIFLHQDSFKKQYSKHLTK